MSLPPPAEGGRAEICRRNSYYKAAEEADLPNNKITRKAACHAVANITSANKEQIQAVIEGNIIGPLVHLMQTADFDTRKEAARAISNAISGGTHDQIKYLVGETEKQAEASDFNIYADKIADCGGLDKITNLQSHDSDMIYEMAYHLLGSYYYVEDESVGGDAIQSSVHRANQQVSIPPA
ncbi:hypothetical protein EJB05_30615, partial [Eragrostis curvula]